MSRRAGLLLCFALILGALWGRSLYESAAELAAGRAAEAAGDLRQARRHYLWSMSWYAPGAAAGEEAAAALWTLSEAALARGDVETALGAARDLRGGALAARWLADPYGDRLDPAHGRIAALMAAQQAGTPSARGQDQATLEAHHLALLRRTYTPRPSLSLVIFISLLGWIGGLGLWIRWGLTPSGGLAGRRGIYLGAGALACLGVWLWAVSAA